MELSFLSEPWAVPRYSHSRGMPQSNHVPSQAVALSLVFVVVIVVVLLVCLYFLSVLFMNWFLLHSPTHLPTVYSRVWRWCCHYDANIWKQIPVTSSYLYRRGTCCYYSKTTMTSWSCGTEGWSCDIRKADHSRRFYENISNLINGYFGPF